MNSMPPKEILDAAQLIKNWAEQQTQGFWCIGPVMKRSDTLIQFVLDTTYDRQEVWEGTNSSHYATTRANLAQALVKNLQIDTTQKYVQ